MCQNHAAGGKHIVLSRLTKRGAEGRVQYVDRRVKDLDREGERLRGSGRGYSIKVTEIKNWRAGTFRRQAVGTNCNTESVNSVCYLT